MWRYVTSVTMTFEGAGLRADKSCDTKLDKFLYALPEQYPALPKDLLARGLMTCASGADLSEPLTEEQRVQLRKFMNKLRTLCVPMMAYLTQNIVTPRVVPRGTVQEAALASEIIKTLLKDYPETPKGRYNKYLSHVMRFLYGRATMSSITARPEDLFRMDVDTTMVGPDGTERSLRDLPPSWHMSPARVGWMSAVAKSISRGGVRRVSTSRRRITPKKNTQTKTKTMTRTRTGKKKGGKKVGTRTKTKTGTKNTKTRTKTKTGTKKTTRTKTKTKTKTKSKRHLKPTPRSNSRHRG